MTDPTNNYPPGYEEPEDNSVFHETQCDDEIELDLFDKYGRENETFEQFCDRAWKEIGHNWRQLLNR